MKTHPSSATGVVVTLVPGLVDRVVLMVVELHVCLLSPAACGLILSLNTPSEERFTNGQFL